MIKSIETEVSLMQGYFAFLDAVQLPLAVAQGADIVYINKYAADITDIGQAIAGAVNAQQVNVCGAEYTVYTLREKRVQQPLESRLGTALDCVRQALDAMSVIVYRNTDDYERKAAVHRAYPQTGIKRSTELMAIESGREFMTAEGCDIYVCRGRQTCLLCAFAQGRVLTRNELEYMKCAARLAESIILESGQKPGLLGDSASILENRAIAAVWLDGDLNIIELRGRGLAHMGRSNDEYIGHSLYEYDFDDRFLALARNMARGKSGSLTITLGGEWFDVYTAADGPYICALLVNTNESVRMRDSYAAASGSLDIVALSMRVGFWSVECSTGKISCDEGCCNIWGVPYYPDTAAQELISAIGHSNYESIRKTIDSLAQNPSNTFVKYSFPPVEIRGETRYIEQRAKLVWESGELTRIVGMVQDVTDGRNMELAVQHEQAQNEAMKQVLLSCAYYESPAEGISNALDASARLLSAQSPRIIFRSREPWQEGVCPAETVYEWDYKITLLSEQIARAGYACDELNGTKMLYVTASDSDCDAVMLFMRTSEPWRDDEIAFAIASCGVIGMALRRIKMESQLRTAVVAAQAGNRAKSDFLSQMSHEIRTPLNAVLGMSLLASEQEDMDMVRGYLDKVISAGRHLHGIISDILDLSRIEAGKLELVPEKIDIRELIGDVCDMIDFSAKNKALSFTANISEDFPRYVIGDRNHIGQIIINLLNNAVKFTREGEVGFEASACGEMVIFRIRDTGIGIKADEQSRLFEAFERLDRESNREVGGTGLGLHITSLLVAMMGGRLEVESEYGKGSLFTVSIPLERAQGDDEKMSAKLVGAEGVHALIVDDSPVGAMVTTGLLARYSITSDVAECAARAIELASERKYDIIFMDHMLPDFDGAEACRRLRANGVDTPVAALTANVLPEHRELFLAAGANGFLSKPVEIKQLEQVLAALLSKDRLRFE